MPVTLAPAIDVNPAPFADILSTDNVLEILLKAKLALPANKPALLY